MKFNKMMTNVLSALIMVSMVGTSVQVPTLAAVTNAGRAIVAGTVAVSYTHLDVYKRQHR